MLWVGAEDRKWKREMEAWCERSRRIDRWRDIMEEQGEEEETVTRILLMCNGTLPERCWDAAVWWMRRRVTVRGVGWRPGGGDRELMVFGKYRRWRASQVKEQV